MKLYNPIYVIMGLLSLSAALPISLGMPLSIRSLFSSSSCSNYNILLDLDDFVANAWSRLAAVEDEVSTAEGLPATDLVRG